MDTDRVIHTLIEEKASKWERFQNYKTCATHLHRTRGLAFHFASLIVMQQVAKTVITRKPESSVLFAAGAKRPDRGFRGMTIVL